jgi:hypothetical protein
MSTRPTLELFEPTLRQLTSELKSHTQHSRAASFLSVVRRFLAQHRESPPAGFEGGVAELEALFADALLAAVRTSPSASVLMVAIQFLRERQMAVENEPVGPVPLPDEVLQSLPFPTNAREE